ncbi:MAG: RND transporter [Gammaproteobacteria bacterium]|nr:RND transporter [Gammaproteobacteria bacterium]
MKWIDKIPLIPLSIASIFMMAAPFVPEPHLVEKIGMLMAGELSKPIDIFDLFWHLTPLTLLLIRLYRLNANKSTGTGS